MNIIDLKPVGKIILNEKTPDRPERFEHYLIPYYQRGYRWDVEHVTALLEDIHNFMNSDEKKYCLQPIVIVPRLDDEGLNIWEVIDGQQRLITMHIIFNYLNRPRYSLFFDKRNLSTDFLKNLSIETYKHDDPDFHFMSQAYEIVKQYFDTKIKNDVGYIDDFNSTLTKRVEIIWYQIEELKALSDVDKIEKKKINIFNRLNVGKIPLTDAELIRALLLSKIKFGISDREAILRQSEISSEWHRIEMELRDEEFWYFLNNKKFVETSSAIEFIFKLIAQESAKKYSTYMWFEKEIKAENPTQEMENATKLWIKTKEYFAKLKYWFNDDFLYHHIGFLLATTDKPISTLRTIIENSDCGKEAFKIWIKNEVISEMENINLDELSYEKNTSELKKVFLLHNIITMNASVKSRFPFNLYKDVVNNGGWSIEHIHAQQTKPMKDREAIKEWLEETHKAIKDLGTIEKKYTDEDGKEHIECISISNEIKERVSSMNNIDVKEIDFEKFNALKTEIVQLFDSESLHILDNLTLLSKKNNSSLNNSIFPVKRIKIIEMEKEGQFIPIITKNIFLKYYSDTNLQPYYWSKNDKAMYYRDIQTKLDQYLTK